MQLLLLSALIVAVSSQTLIDPFVQPSDCGAGEMFDFSRLKCAECPASTEPAPDRLSCVCLPGFSKLEDYGGFGIRCAECVAGADGTRRWPTPDGWDCRPCQKEGTNDILITDGGSCPACTNAENFKSFRNSYGTLEVTQKCERCLGNTMPSPSGDRCIRCNDLIQGRDCQCKASDTATGVPKVFGGVCFDTETTKLEPISDAASLYQMKYRGGLVDSWYGEQGEGYIREHLQAALALCGKGNLTACQVVGNLCVLTHYKDREVATPSPCREYQFLASQRGRGSFREWEKWLPWLYYLNGPRLTETEDITTRFTFDESLPNSQIRLWAAHYSLNGTYGGLKRVVGGTLQLCQSEQWVLDAAYVFGRRYRQSCQISVQDLWNKYRLEFLDLYLEMEGVDGKRKLYPVPILNRNLSPGDSRLQYTRRLFLVDNVSGKEYASGPASRAKFVRYPVSITIHVHLQATKNGQIFPPHVEVEYADVMGEEYDENKKVETRFAVEYSMETRRHEKDIEIVMGTLCSLGGLWTLLRTMVWYRRAGKGVVDFATVAKCLLILAGTLADIFFIVMLATTLWILVAYKNQKTVVYMVLSREQEFSFTVYVGLAAALKAVEMFNLILEQVTTETFFIDWERPRGQVIPKYKMNAEADPERGEAAAAAAAAAEARPAAAELKAGEMIESPVTIWRTYLVANEWAELCSYRKTSYALQLFLMVLLLKVLHLENIAIVEPNVNLGVVPAEFEDSRMSRFGLAAGLYLAIGLTQWFLNVFLVERCVVNHFGNFVDLCSIANISVLCLTRPQFGFYVHGRSVHGHADTNMREMNEMLQRERDNLCSRRGLENNDDVQCFTVVLPTSFREEFENVVAPLRNASPAAAHLSGQDLVTAETETVIDVYTRANAFLAAFVEQRGDWTYRVRDRTAMEAIMDMDCGDTTTTGEFLRDPSEAGFSAAFLYGQEWVQLSFDALLFCVVDLVAHDFLLAAVVTFVVVSGMRKIRELGGTRRLVRTSLVDSRFLI